MKRADVSADIRVNEAMHVKQHITATLVPCIFLLKVDRRLPNSKMSSTMHGRQRPPASSS